MSEQRLGDYTFTHKLMVAWGREGKWTEMCERHCWVSGGYKDGAVLGHPPIPGKQCVRGAKTHVQALVRVIKCHVGVQEKVRSRVWRLEARPDFSIASRGR